MSTETSVTDRYKINVDREERGRTRCEEGGRRRGAPGFALGIVVMGAMELCEAVGTGAAGYLTNIHTYIHTKSKKSPR